ncbi:MAG: hypothetical protein ED559_13920 [Phycisphaera sp.]|nr:MAG: hypothetical protein ED559_13920 [Phycisphaera sp.]
MKAGKLIMLVSLALVLGAAWWYLSKNWDAISSLRITNPLLVVLLTVLMISRMTLRGVFQWQLLRSVGSQIGLVETLKLGYAGLMLNQLLILPVGAGYRAAYMKKAHALPFKHFASTMAALYIYFLAASAALGLAAMGWLASRGAAFDPIAGVVLAVILLGCAALVISPKLIPNAGNLRTKTDRVLDGWHMIVGSPRLIAGASAVVLLSMFVNVVGIVAAFGAFEIGMDSPGALLLMSSQRVGSLIRLTPGSVGFQEMVSLYYAQMLTVTSAQTAVVLVLVRVVNMLVGVGLGAPSLWLLQRQGDQTEQADKDTSSTPAAKDDS